MTTTSHQWKALLQRQAEALQSLRTPHRWTESSSVRLEEAAVLGCYAIQRLLNACLLADSLVHGVFPMTAYPARRRAPGLLTEAPLDALYDLQAGREVAHDLLFVCHQVTHNCVFDPVFGDGRALRAVHVTSDRQRRVALYALGIETLRGAFLDVAGSP